MSGPLLELRGISKSFTGTRALDGVSLTVGAGEVVALMGENGAGKSTLMKILSGVWPDGTFEGELWVAQPGGAQERARFETTRDAHESGIAMIHQELSVFGELTVAEHLELDQLPAWIDWPAVFARTQAFLDGLGFGLRAQDRVRTLSVGGQQLVEIARALYRKARVLIFDEPTSALTESEVRKLTTIIDQLRERGHGIIYITHRMDEVFRLADRMVVLRDGRNAGEALAYSTPGQREARAKLEPQLLSWMVGRPIHDIYPPLNTAIGEEILRVEGLQVAPPGEGARKRVDGLSFTLRKGEVLGLAGLLGAGRSEALEGLFGVLEGSGPRGPGYQVQGKVYYRGKELKPGTPRDAIAQRFAFVSEDRKGSGLVLGQSILRNMTLPALSSQGSPFTESPRMLAPLLQGEERARASTWSQDLRIRLASLDQAVGELSGGNQQKVVLAKWLLAAPEVLFLDEPTRGIDVGAKVEIYQWIQKLAAQGMAIIVASSEMPEVIGIAHRILVLREGVLSSELSRAEATQEKIMKAAAL